MTPQSEFLVLARLAPDKVAGLRALLAGMNARPGLADPNNALVPFGAFPALHVARFVVLDDLTLGDLAAFGSSFPDAPLYLAFLGDCDGDPDRLLDEVAARCDEGLKRIFGFCEGFSATTDLRRWMAERQVAASAGYVNTLGRTVVQAREEAVLRGALKSELARAAAEGLARPEALHARLRARVLQSGPALTPEQPTPLPWLLGHVGAFLLGALILLIAAPILLVTAPLWLVILRRHETRDPEIATPYDRARRRTIAQAEDHDVTNPFTAIGAIKPGLFRLAIVRAVLWLLNFGNSQIYKRGRLARVGTIHFARWVVIDEGRRVLFCSNYDGSLDSYMDDFINKAAFGLNLVFSNGVGYPTTRFLLLGGAQREEQFKTFLRRRQQATDVWYKAYPGLSAYDLYRNAEIRKGLEKPGLSGEALHRWLALI
jgi:hypothetical protein